MKDDPVAAAREALAVFNTEGADAFAAHATPDFVLETWPDWPGGGVFEGRAAAIRFLRDFQADMAAMMGNTQFAGEDYMHAGGGVVVVTVRSALRGASSGIETPYEAHAVVEVTGRLTRSLRFFYTRDEALTAADALARAQELRS